VRCSYMRQHISRPQQPEICAGFSDSLWSLASWRLTGLSAGSHVEQQSSRPQLPRPPTMRAASLELVMAGNVQYRENAFQLASSGLDTVLQQTRNNAVPLNAAVGWQQDLGTTRVEALSGEFDTSISYLGESSPYSGYSTSQFLFQHFQVDAEGRTDQRGARSLQSQGIYLVTQRGNE